MNRTLHIPTRRRTACTAAASVVLALLFMHPVLALMGEYHFSKSNAVKSVIMGEYNIDDEPDPRLDAYYAAIRLMKRAVALVPSEPDYNKAVSDMYLRLAVWRRTMTLVGSEVPAEMEGEEHYMDLSRKYIDRAILGEPMRAEFHFASGVLHDYRQEPLAAERELDLAATAWPMNGALRFFVALHHLNNGRQGLALEQARALADLDTSYIFVDNVVRELQSESLNAAYLKLLYRSYLFASFELGWRVSKRMDVLDGMVPEVREASDVLELYYEWRGLP